MSETESKPGISMPRDNLPEFLSNPRESPIWPISTELINTMIFEREDFLFRIWRAPAVDKHPQVRRCIGVVEVTDLQEEEPKPIGLHWSNSIN